MNRLARHPNFAPTALAIAISLVIAQLHAADLPTGGNIVGGSGSISQGGNSLNVQQNSDKLITNWDSFNIGAGNTVNFHQPGSNSVALNRVIGEDASAIFGNLNANGKVFLVNPNGVLFGQGAAVNVGALVASTLSLSDQDFNDGNYQFQADGNNAAVINRGSITADGGAVALLGGQVSNHGVIQANQGTVTLAAGDKITLDFAGDGLLNVTVDEGTLNALVENHQLIRANGGQVVMTATATNALLQSVVNNTGVIEAQTLDNQSGTIILKGGFNGGTVNVAGTLDASAPDSGDGGFIDTSGAHVKIADGTQVTTKANNGTTGEWLIDPTDFYITDSNDSQTSSSIGATTLSANLENNNVTLATVSEGEEPGDMYVNGELSWDAATILELRAHRNLHINKAITAVNGHLRLNAASEVTADGAIDTASFALLRGTWKQLGPELPDFDTGIFYISTSNSTFIRAIGGTGATTDPYQLTDIYGVQGIASHNLLTKSFVLANDIDASGTINWAGGAGYVPIGELWNAFTGNFSGQGHVIRDLYIFRPTWTYVGLFGRADPGSSISNVGLENVNIFGRTYVGALVGYNSANINQTYATGTVTGLGNGVGGLIGGTGWAHNILNSWTDVTVRATGNQVGGLAGAHGGGVLANSFALGDVTGHDIVGGLVGLTGSKIYGTYATGKVTGWSEVGGLLGSFSGGNPGDYDLANSYATGDVIGSGHSVGGLIGWNSLKVSNAYATGNVIGTNYVGGLVGQHSARYGNSYLIIETAYATGTVQANTSDVGALVGKSDANITASFFNQDKNPLLAGVGLGSSDGTTSLTTAQMMDLDSFSTAWGSAINADGGTGSVWRIYDGSTTPLLRSFLTPLTIDGGNTTVTYNGLVQTGQWTASTEYDANLLLGNEIVGKKNVGSYELDLGGLYSSQQGYDLVVSNGTLTINKAQATVTANSGATTYNGTEQSISGFTIDGLVNGEDESVVTGVTTSGGKGTNAGNYVLTIGGGSADNYELSFVDGSLTINKANATVTANSGTTTYNGTEQSISGFTIDGLVNGEDGSVVTGVTTSGGTGTNAGSYVLTVGGGSADNYELSFVDGTLTINKAQATVIANSGATTYNGTEQSIDGFTIEGLVNDEDQSVVTGVTTSGGKGTNAGSYVLTVSGGSADNYELSFVDGALTINKAQATVTANSGTTTYNGTEQSVSGFTVDGLVNGEDASVLSGVTTNGGKGTNAGSYTLTASGSDGNYELTFVDGTLTISKANATVTANSGTTTYNGTEQSVDGFTVDGLVNGEDQSVLTGVTTSGGKGTNAGSYTLTASGSDGNYELTFVDGTLTINKAQATVTANSGTTTYNGTEQSVDGFTVDGLVNGEDASVLNGVSTSGGKGINAGSYTLIASGSDGNYELSFVDGTLTINKAQATVTANSNTTTYNGTEQSVDGFTVDGLVNGEDQSVLTGVTTSGGKGTNAGSYTLTASGSDGNYELTFVDGTLTINKAQATVTANSGTTTYNGTEQSVDGFTVDGLVNGEDASVISGVTTNGGTGINAGSHVLTIGGGSADNYELTFVDGALTIDRKTITADIRALDKLFDGSLNATLEGVLNGTISGDDVALQLSGLFASLMPGENRVLVDASLSGADAGNYQLVAPGEVIARLEGFVQTDDYQSAVVSQPQEQRGLSAPSDTGYQLNVDDDALYLSNLRNPI